MSHYKPVGLYMAGEDPGPKCYTAKRRRPKGSKGVGVKFESELAKKLGPCARHGQWFKFLDAEGVGYAQPDFLLFAPEALYVIECKLGNIPSGRAQLTELYFPILRLVYKLPTFGIVVARHVSEDPEPKLITHSLFDAMRASHSRIPTLQWRERLPLCIPPGLAPQPHHTARRVALTA